MYKARILITGGAGFIGTALAKRLQELKYEVILIDFEHKFNLQHKEFEKYFVDIRYFKNFNIIKNKKFDFIFHLAAQTSGAISQEEPELDVDTNVKGTLNVCNFAKICGVKKIIFTSSMATYGDYQEKIKDDFLQKPLSNYGVSKVCTEHYIKSFEQFGIKNTIFRLFNVYGEGQDMFNLRQGMVSIFIAQSIKSDIIEVTGSLDRYRDFVYISDVISALVLGLLEYTDGKIYNIGSGIKTTVREIIELILSINDKPKEEFKINNIGSHEGDQFGSIADNSNILTLGWNPKVDLVEDLKYTYKYAKEVLV